MKDFPVSRYLWEGKFANGDCQWRYASGMNICEYEDSAKVIAGGFI